MSKNIKLLFFSFFSLGVLILSELIYLYYYKSLSVESLNDKVSFVAYTGLPDLAISQEPSIRHRSLSSVFEIYSIDPVLREYEKATYVISNASEHR